MTFGVLPGCALHAFDSGRKPYFFSTLERLAIFLGIMLYETKAVFSLS